MAMDRINVSQCKGIIPRNECDKSLGLIWFSVRRRDKFILPDRDEYYDGVVGIILIGIIPRLYLLILLIVPWGREGTLVPKIVKVVN